MKLTIRLLPETDGRWIGEVPELPGVLVYGATPEEAALKAKALALRVIAEEIEHGEMIPENRYLAVLDCRMNQWPATKPRRVLAAA